MTFYLISRNRHLKKLAVIKVNLLAVPVICHNGCLTSDQEILGQQICQGCGSAWARVGAQNSCECACMHVLHVTPQNRSLFYVINFVVQKDCFHCSPVFKQLFYAPF